MTLALFLLSAAAQGDSAIAVWDTVRPAPGPLTPEAIAAAKDGWKEVSQTTSSFEGDAAFTNGRVFALFRKEDGAAILYASGPRGMTAGARITLEGTKSGQAARIKSIGLVELTRGAAELDVSWTTALGGAVDAKFRIKRGEVVIQVDPGPQAARLDVGAPGRFVVLPDFYSDDIVLDARKLPLASAELPSDNFLLHLTRQGGAMVMCVFENREQDVKISLSGEREERVVTGSKIEFGTGNKRKVFLALIEGPGVWHAADVRAGDSKKIIRLDWKMPFAASWRCDFTRADGLTDSWDMLLQKEKDSEYIKPAWLGGGEDRIKSNRERWTTVLGTFRYPAWSDPERRGYLQPLETEALTLRGPVVVYPFNRVRETPADTYTMVDLARTCLGTGPCEYILDLGGQKQEYKGRATCSTRDLLTGIYSTGAQKARRKEIEKALVDVVIFVKHIRGRIERYREFAREIREFLAGQARQHPELKEPIADLERIAQEADTRYSRREKQIQTPEEVAAMTEEFKRSLLDNDGPDALAEVKKFAKAVVNVGSNQDELAGELRWVIRALRQKAGILLATEPKMAEIAAEVRSRTHEIMRNPAGHEGARH